MLNLAAILIIILQLLCINSKATIKGEVLRELGVIYNGNFYAISEHPNYTSGGSTQQLASTAGPSSGPGGGGGGSDHPTSSSSTVIRRVIDDDEEDMRL